MSSTGLLRANKIRPRRSVLREKGISCSLWIGCNKNVFFSALKSADVPQSHSIAFFAPKLIATFFLFNKYEGWNFNSGNYLFTTDTK